jgi:hypothetical protein
MNECTQALQKQPSLKQPALYLLHANLLAGKRVNQRFDAALNGGPDFCENETVNIRLLKAKTSAERNTDRRLHRRTFGHLREGNRKKQHKGWISRTEEKRRYRQCKG